MSKLSVEERIHLISQISTLLKNKDYPQNLFALAQSHNPWFDKKNQLSALNILEEQLKIENVVKFSKNYPNIHVENELRSIGLILAGNIPMVGLQDILYVFLSGNKSLIKLSSQDDVWIPFFIGRLISLDSRASQYFQFIEKLEKFDSVIATGSNNSARYFDYYFGKKPNIIRKNRNSIAILDGSESTEDYKKLGEDIFSYYGLGCRNISKIYIPLNFDFPKFLDALEGFKEIIDQHKYHNNYDYNKSIFLLNKVNHYDNGFLLVCENKNIVSSIACLNFEYYADLNALEKEIQLMSNSIQCIVRQSPKVKNEFSFGASQSPSLMDYADGVDVMEFLSD